MPRQLRLAVAAFALVAFAVSPAAAQLPSPEQRAYNVVDDAIAEFDIASDRGEMTRAARRILSAAESVVSTFRAAEPGREAAHGRFHSARDRRAESAAHAAYARLVDVPGADHARASDAHIAVLRAVAAALGRAVRRLSTAAGRLTDSYYPGTRAAELTQAVAAMDRAAAVPGGLVRQFNIETLGGNPGLASRFKAAIDTLIIAARETVTVLESHVQLVEQEAQRYETDPEPYVPDALPRVRQSPAIEVLPAADLDAWADQVRDAVMEVERAAGEAERTAAGTGSWISRFTGCEATHLRLLRAVGRVQDLTLGSGRPDFIPGGAGSQAWRQLRERLEEPRRRAREACRSIEPPR